jgi:VCBS repeat protein/ASPM-SPD-2-Hydin domain-containing protein/FG-GAP repeat protein
MHRHHVCFSTALAVALCVAGLVLPVWGQFEARGTSPVASLSFSIALGDFNHDGILDAAAPSFETGQVAVLLGKGNGTFQSPVYYSVGGGPESVAVADFNHDGSLDLAVTGNGTTTGIISILFGNGDGTFQPAVDVSINSYPSYVAVGDLNGDHIPDLIAVDSPYISVLLGNGDGTFQPPVDTPFSPAPVIGIGDFNRDGKLDVAAAVQSGIGSTVTILLGNGDGTFQLGASYDIGADPLSVAVADFRRIGILDLAITEGDGVDVLLGNGDGTFGSTVNYGGAQTFGVAVGDFNRDGKLDLVATGFSFGTDVIGLLLGNGDGTFHPMQVYPTGNIAGIALAVGDLNGDHQTDLATAATPSDIAVLLNTGVVSFSPITPLKFPSQLVGTTSASQTVTLTNTATTTLTISSITETSKQFNMTTTCGSSVAPGGNCSFTVSFQPQSKGGQSGIISIRDSASTKPQVIELTGVGTVVTVSPSTLNFGSQKVGTKSKPQAVIVTNHGSTVLNFTSIQISDNFEFTQTNNCGTQIAAGASCKIAVTFAPFQKGTESGHLTITDDGGGSPQVVLLTGTGT